MAKPDQGRTSHARTVDLTQHPLDRVESAREAFRAAQEVRAKQANQQKGSDSRSPGVSSPMVTRDAPGLAPKPPQQIRQAVDSKHYNKRLAAEKAQAAERAAKLARAAQQHRQNQMQQGQEQGRDRGR